MGGYPGFYGYHDGGWSWGAWVLGILVTVAFWGLLITAVVWMVRAFRHGGRGGTGPMVYPGPATPYRPTGGADPEAILAQRYARGEIDEEEYRARLAVLRGPTMGGPTMAGPTMGGPGRAGPTVV